MGWFSSITHAFKSVEHAVLGNNVIKWVDPASYWTYEDIQRRTGQAATALGTLLGLSPKAPNLGGGESASAPAPAAQASTGEVSATDKVKALAARRRRQGAGGVGSTLLTSDDSLDRNTMLGE